ncbi:MAG: DUF2961 domain-containing protein, partial [Planctomycetota bacterium]
MSSHGGPGGVGTGLGGLSRLSLAKTRSISAENPRGGKGTGGMATEGTGAECARDLGRGWKVSPCVRIAPGETYTLAEIEGPGAVQSMWLSGDVSRKGPAARCYILRIYWDGQERPSVECPVADFFANGWGESAQLSSLPVAVNPNRAYNCCWEMPFRKSCRITMENRHTDPLRHFYQINYHYNARFPPQHLRASESRMPFRCSSLSLRLRWDLAERLR